MRDETIISLVLIFLCQIGGLPSPALTPRIVPRLLDVESTCAAATNAEINCLIFKQCICSSTEDVIPYEVGCFVAQQPSIFSRRYANESHFRRTVFEELINPWLVNAQVCDFDHFEQFDFCVKFAYISSFCDQS